MAVNVKHLDDISKKYEQLSNMLAVLNGGIVHFKKLNIDKVSPIGFINFDEVHDVFRDSLIQRFKICTELFWKYLKRYLEIYGGPVEFNAPIPTVRAAFAAALVKESEAESALKMIKDRNLTSHMYKEDIAEYLVKAIPAYYMLMHEISERLAPKNKLA